MVSVRLDITAKCYGTGLQQRSDTKHLDFQLARGESDRLQEKEGPDTNNAVGPFDFIHCLLC